MEFSHPPGANGAAVPNSPGAILDEQGNPIPPRPDGTIPIPKKDDIYCFDLTVKAPRDAGVRAVRFRIENPGSGDAFVFGASPQPPPWTVNATGSSLAAFGVGGQDPIPPGGTRTVRVCTTKKNLRISWELEDTSGNPLPNESGEIQLNHS